MKVLATLGQTVLVTGQQVTAPMDMDEILPMFTKLRLLLQDDDTDATEILEDLQSLTGGQYAAAFDSLASACGDYDFDTALQYLDKLESGLKQV